MVVVDNVLFVLTYFATTHDLIFGLDVVPKRQFVSWETRMWS